MRHVKMRDKRSVVESLIKKLAPVKQKLLDVLLAGTGKALPLQLGIGDVSYCNDSTIQVQISEQEVNECTTNEIFSIIVDFKIAHEAEHARSTEDEPYIEAMKAAYEVLMDLAKQEGIRLYEKGVMSICQYLTNSLEDGRIERLMCRRITGMDKKRRWVRLKDWNNGEYKKGLDDMSAALNQVLSLATLYTIHPSKALVGIGRYQKGFIKARKGSKLHKALQKCKKHIRKAINADTCHGLKDPMCEIATHLYPFIKKELEMDSLTQKIMDYIEAILKQLAAESVNIGKCVVPGTTSGEGSESGSAEDDESDDAETEDYPEDTAEMGNTEQLLEKDTRDETLEGILSKAYDSTEMADLRYDVPSRSTKTVLPVDLKCRSSKLRRTLQEIIRQKSTPNLQNQKQGRLNLRQLNKLATGQQDFYSRKGNPHLPSIACYLLKDNSGSMGCRAGKDASGKNYSKSDAAYEALAVIEDALFSLPHKIPFKITDFDALSTTSVRHLVVKDWDETRESWSYSLTTRDSNDDGFGNKDGYSIREATWDLSRRSEEKKILIVLSDGQPTEYVGNGYLDVQLAVKQARQQGIAVIAIFFGNEEFLENSKDVYATMYEKDYIGVVPNQIVSELEKILKKII